MHAGLCETQRLPPGWAAGLFWRGAGACGNCDDCLEPPELVDGTVAAQKLLSCVYRLWKERGQRFGAGQAIDILRGKRSEKVAKWRHDELSVFGIGADLPESAWRRVLRHLIAFGLLEVDHASYGTLVFRQPAAARYSRASIA